MMGEDSQGPEQDFCEVWRKSWEAVLSRLGTNPPGVSFSEAAAAASPPSGKDAMKAAIRFSGGGTLKGDLLWVVEKPVVLQLGQLLVSEPFDPAVEVTERHRDALADLLRQVADHAATMWKEKNGGGTELSFQPYSGVEPASLHSYVFKMYAGNASELSLRLHLTEELYKGLAVVQSAAGETDDQAAGPTPALPHNIGLLLDIEMEAAIRIGEKEMLVRDLQTLMPGAVVELEQMVNEPASLYVAGRKVARGELVIVDGNFGLRITEVASVNQRVELLKF